MNHVVIGIPFCTEPIGQIEMAVRSIFSQTMTEWRLILVSDGAPECTLEHLGTIRDERVELVHDGANRGLAARLNEISTLADSELIFRMDADDVMMPSRLLVQQNFMIANPDVDVVGARAIAVNRDGAPLGLFREAMLPVEPSGYLASNVFTHPTVAARARWFRENPYDPSIRRAEDKELWLRTSPMSTFAKLSDPVLFYRIESRPNVDKYRATCRDDRLVLKRYASDRVSRIEQARLIATSHVKERAVAILAASPAHKVYAQRRYAPLLAGEMNAYRRMARQIALTRVPGWAAERTTR